MIKKSLLFVSIISIIIGGFIYYKIFVENIIKLNKETKTIYIPSNSTFKDVIKILKIESGLNSKTTFTYLSRLSNYSTNIKAGKYKIQNNCSVYSLLRTLKKPLPVKVTFNNIRFIEKFAGIIGNQVEPDSGAIMAFLNNQDSLNLLGYNKETIISMFIPNTYEFWWNTNITKFMQKMKLEHDAFWNKDRVSKAKSMNMTPLEITILASIVQEETTKISEMPIIAGVYLNRLKIGMLLQADPTARFAYGNFDVKRITDNYTKTESPYNTYIYKGLPPGPICMVNSITIDQVLNYQKHNYLYFCVKSDNSGTHVFSTNFNDHRKNAIKYHKYLNQLKIYN